MKRLLLTLSIVSIVLLAVLAVKNEFARLLPTEGFGMSEIDDNENIDDLFMGASTFRKGLDIEVLEQLPGKTFMLNYNGNQPVLMQKELEYLLDHGVSIKRLFIDFYPYTVAQQPRLSDTRLLLDTDLRFKLGLWQKLSSVAPQPFLKRLTDGYEFFVSANNMTILWYPLYRRQSLARNRHGGQTGMQHIHGSTKENLDRQSSFGKRDGIQESQLEAIREIIRICASNQIELRFIEIPKYHLLLKDPDYIEFADQVSKVIDETAGPGHIIRADQIQLDTAEPEYFADWVHLSGTGAHLNTAQLITVIKGD